MKEILEYVARHLVDEPDAVEVTEVQGERSVILQLHVAPDDMGKVIGKKGRTAKALRSVIRAAGIQRGVTTIVEIVEGAGGPSARGRPDGNGDLEEDESEIPDEVESPDEDTGEAHGPDDVGGNESPDVETESEDSEDPSR